MMRAMRLVLPPRHGKFAAYVRSESFGVFYELTSFAVGFLFAFGLRTIWPLAVIPLLLPVILLALRYWRSATTAVLTWVVISTAATFVCRPGWDSLGWL